MSVYVPPFPNSVAYALLCPMQKNIVLILQWPVYIALKTPLCMWDNDIQVY